MTQKMTPEQRDIKLLHRTSELADMARAAGNHPFGALLADQDGNILIEAGNAFSTQGGPGHAEAIVAQKAALAYSTEVLAKCLLVTSVEPCAMCAGTQYWAGIGTLVFGITEKRLAKLTGDNEENLTMDLPAATVFDAGQRKTAIRGPYAEAALEAAIVKSHEGFW